MRARSRFAWLVYAACALLLVDTLGWATWQGLRLEQRERDARARTQREQAVRLALWRMESVVTPLLARESARPYFHYWPEYAAEQPYATAWRITPDSVVRPSPLREQPADIASHWLRLHYQTDLSGALMAPAAAGGASEPSAVRARRDAAALRTLLMPRQQQETDAFAEMVPDAEMSSDPAAEITSEAKSNDVGGLAARQANLARAQSAQQYLYEPRPEDFRDAGAAGGAVVRGPSRCVRCPLAADGRRAAARVRAIR